MKKLTTGIVSGIVLAVTAALFLLLGDELFWLPVFWIGFTAVLVLEFVTAVLLILCGGHPRRFAAALTFAIATGLVLIVSLLFNAAESVAYGKYISLLMVIVALASVSAVILWSHTSVVETDEKRRENARAYFSSCRNVVAALRHGCEGKACDAALKDLEEDLRYVDDTQFTDLDGGIRDQLSQLANKMEDPAYDPMADIADLKDLIKQRQYLLHG